MQKGFKETHARGIAEGRYHATILPPFKGAKRRVATVFDHKTLLPVDSWEVSKFR